MKQRIAAIFTVIMLMWSNSTAMTLHAPSPVFTLNGKLNCPVISERGGTAYLQLTLTTPNIIGEKQRKPMNLSIVIDRSGSMGDQQKMEFVKKAFASLVDQLQPSDILSIVVYDDIVDVIRRAKKVGNNKQSIKRLIDEVYPRNSTNLGGGLVEGLRQSEKYAGKEFINRVVLLSDGLANVGITDPIELNRIAKQYRNKSISVTAMGVGLDYNENLMMGLSESGGGNYYFIEHPHSLAAIIRQEFELASSVIAQNGAIYLTLGDNVHVQDVVGCEFKNENARYIIPIGDLYANETREFTVELSVPAGTGNRIVASGELRYESATIIASYPTFSAKVTYTKDFAEIEKNRDISTQAKADIAVSTRKVEQAMQAMDNGDQAAAEMRLNEAKDLMSTSPAASAAGASGESVRSQLGKIESYQKTAKEDDSRKAKKSIQYENYKTRKNK
ncbi:MAG: VWA domain-containing protein [Bacteroidota bacterium]|nr:VWA domain-containing protein [Bacteroidota bacterium]